MNDSLEVKKETCEQQEDKDEKCAICLQKFSSFKSKSFASKCFHSFCFECILEWSKIKYNCPLCKTEFDRILYDLVSRLEFKQYLLKILEKDNPSLDIISISPGKPFSQPVLVSRASWLVNSEQAPIEFRMLVYKNKWYASPNQIQTDIRIANIDLEFASNQDQTENKNINNETLNCISFKSVNRFRDIRPEWFKKNPACSHRLMQFLYRELKALAGIMPSNSSDRLNHSMRSELITFIINLIKKVNIDSEKFYQELSEHIRPLKYARHFQHELNCFAKSTSSDLIEYDSKCVYYKENQIPKNNDLFLVNSKIIPFDSLPVNLSKYRLVKREVNTIQDYYEEFESGFSNNQPTTSRRIEQNEQRNQARSDSEYSSYCEIVTPPRRKTPPLLVISSDSDDECSSLSLKRARSRTRSRSTSSERINKKKIHKKKHKKHKKSKKNKKSHKKHKSRSRSESISRNRPRTRSLT